MIDFTEYFLGLSRTDMMGHRVGTLSVRSVHAVGTPPSLRPAAAARPVTSRTRTPQHARFRTARETAPAEAHRGASVAFMNHCCQIATSQPSATYSFIPRPADPFLFNSAHCENTTHLRAQVAAPDCLILSKFRSASARRANASITADSQSSTCRPAASTRSYSYASTSHWGRS